MVELVAVAEEAAVAARAAKAVQAVTMGVVGVMVVSVGILINIVMAMAVQAVLEALAVLVGEEMDITTTTLMVYGKKLITTPISEQVAQVALLGNQGQVGQAKEEQEVKEVKEEDSNRMETQVIKAELVLLERVSMAVAV